MLWRYESAKPNPKETVKNDLRSREHSPRGKTEEMEPSNPKKKLEAGLYDRLQI